MAGFSRLLRRDFVDFEASNRYNAILYILSFILVVNSKKKVENRVRLVSLKFCPVFDDGDGHRSSGKKAKNIPSKLTKYSNGVS